MTTSEIAPNPSAPSAPPTLSHRQVLVAFSGLVLVMLLAALDSTIVSTALPTIVGELGGLEHLAWVVTAYLLAQTIVTPIYGKLGDLYGRKIVLQSAVVLFLIGSALCGISSGMTQLIIFRFVQGLGGGGLNVTTQAVVGDLVPPRERGRYQGIFGAVYGLASIAGPLLGGFFTTQLTWRWIFYINLPLGVVALGVLASTLPSQTLRRSHSIDYYGAGLLALALSAITLFADLGGGLYAWQSPLIIGLIAASVLSLVVFVLVERKVAEPVLPPRLFAQPAFSLTSIVGLIVGFALFGSITYFPVYLQVVKGVSPTASGLQMVPMMLGMLTTSIVSGQLISRTGRYKIFPVFGTGIMTLGLFLLSTLTPQSSAGLASALLMVLGVGLGLVMQVLVIAVQNAVEYRDLGVATSGATLFRLIGGSLGTAVLGAIFAGQLAANMSRMMPRDAAGHAVSVGRGMSPQMLAHLSSGARTAYFAAFTRSLHTVFLVAAAVCAVGFLMSLFLPERPLRATIAAAAGEAGQESGEAFGRPADEASTAAMLLATLSSMADRQVQRLHIQRIVERAGENLTPLAAWLLVELERTPDGDPVATAHLRGVPAPRSREALDELRQAGLITSGPGAVAVEDTHALTTAGCETLTRLVTARREHLEQLAAEWNPTGEEQTADYLRRAVRDLVPDVRPSA